MRTRDPVLERIARLNPVSAAGPRSEAQVRQADRVLERARSRAGSTPAAGTTRRLLRRRQAAILVAVIVSMGMLAAAAVALNPFSALTGVFVHAGDRNARAIGTGEAIALGAPDDVSVGIKLTHDIPFAPGYGSWRAGTIAFQTTLGGGAQLGHANITTSALRWQVAQGAVCSWLNYYVSSQSAGDTAAVSTAAAQIKAAPTWPAITGLNYPAGLGAVVAAVGAGDAKLVQALIDTGQAGTCLAVGPFPPVGLSAADRLAKLAAARQVGQREIASDPVAQRLRLSGSLDG